MQFFVWATILSFVCNFIWFIYSSLWGCFVCACRLQDWRCLWCRGTVHTACRPLLTTRCPLGPCRLSIVPPTALTTIGQPYHTVKTKVYHGKDCAIGRLCHTVKITVYLGKDYAIGRLCHTVKTTVYLGKDYTIGRLCHTVKTTVYLGKDYTIGRL